MLTLGQPLFAAMPREESSVRQLFAESNGAAHSVVPDSFGQVTAKTNFDSPVVVVNIQDLHSHPQAQKNITGILAALSKQYNVKKVFIEGASGNVEVSWIKNISDEKFRERLSVQMLNSGVLTAGENFALNNNVELFGLEDKEVHEQNIKRLSRIYENEEKYASIAKSIKDEINVLAKTALSAENVKFIDTVEKYRAQKIDTAKYYKILLDYVEEISAAPGKYYNALPITNYSISEIEKVIALDKASKKLRRKKVSVELAKEIQEMKNTMSFSEYEDFIRYSANMQDIDAVCKFLYSKGVDGKTHPNLKTFVLLKELNSNINPVTLFEQEHALQEGIREALAGTQYEREISFLTSFSYYFEGYLTNQLTASGEYFFNKYAKDFKEIYAKHAFINVLPVIHEDFDFFGKYYSTNNKRNEIFINNVEKQVKLDTGKQYSQKDAGTMLKNAAEVIVLITGGYHSKGITELLNGKKVSSIVITPRIADDNFDTASLSYKETIISQGKVLKEALAFIVSSKLSPERRAYILGQTIAYLAANGVMFNENNINYLYEIMQEKIKEVFPVDTPQVVFQQQSNSIFMYIGNSEPIILAKDAHGNISFNYTRQARQEQVSASEKKSTVQKITSYFMKAFINAELADKSNEILYAVVKELFMENTAMYQWGPIPEIEKRMRMIEAGDTAVSRTIDGINISDVSRLPHFFQEAALIKQIELENNDSNKPSGGSKGKIMTPKEFFLSITQLFGVLFSIFKECEKAAAYTIDSTSETEVRKEEANISQLAAIKYTKKIMNGNFVRSLPHRVQVWLGSALETLVVKPALKAIDPEISGIFAAAHGQAGQAYIDRMETDIKFQIQAKNTSRMVFTVLTLPVTLMLYAYIQTITIVPNAILLSIGLAVPLVMMIAAVAGGIKESYVHYKSNLEVETAREKGESFYAPEMTLPVIKKILDSVSWMPVKIKIALAAIAETIIMKPLIVKNMQQKYVADSKTHGRITAAVFGAVGFGVSAAISLITKISFVFLAAIAALVTILINAVVYNVKIAFAVYRDKISTVHKENIEQGSSGYIKRVASVFVFPVLTVAAAGALTIFLINGSVAALSAAIASGVIVLSAIIKLFIDSMRPVYQDYKRYTSKKSKKTMDLYGATHQSLNINLFYLRSSTINTPIEALHRTEFKMKKTKFGAEMNILLFPARYVKRIGERKIYDNLTFVARARDKNNTPIFAVFDKVSGSVILAPYRDPEEFPEPLYLTFDEMADALYRNSNKLMEFITNRFTGMGHTEFENTEPSVVEIDTIDRNHKGVDRSKVRIHWYSYDNSELLKNSDLNYEIESARNIAKQEKGMRMKRYFVFLENNINTKEKFADYLENTFIQLSNGNIIVTPELAKNLADAGHLKAILDLLHEKGASIMVSRSAKNTVQLPQSAEQLFDGVYLADELMFELKTESQKKALEISKPEDFAKENFRKIINGQDYEYIVIPESVIENYVKENPILSKINLLDFLSGLFEDTSFSSTRKLEGLIRNYDINYFVDKFGKVDRSEIDDIIRATYDNNNSDPYSATDNVPLRNFLVSKIGEHAEIVKIYDAYMELNPKKDSFRTRFIEDYFTKILVATEYSKRANLYHDTRRLNWDAENITGIILLEQAFLRADRKRLVDDGRMAKLLQEKNDKYRKPGYLNEENYLEELSFIYVEGSSDGAIFRIPGSERLAGSLIDALFYFGAKIEIPEIDKDFTRKLRMNVNAAAVIARQA